MADLKGRNLPAIDDSDSDAETGIGSGNSGKVLVSRSDNVNVTGRACLPPCAAGDRCLACVPR